MILKCESIKNKIKKMELMVQMVGHTTVWVSPGPAPLPLENHQFSPNRRGAGPSICGGGNNLSGSATNTKYLRTHNLQRIVFGRSIIFQYF